MPPLGNMTRKTKIRILVPKPKPKQDNPNVKAPNKPVGEEEVVVRFGGTRRKYRGGGWKNALRAELAKMERLNANAEHEHRFKPKYLQNAYRENRKTVRNLMIHALEAENKNTAKKRINVALKKSEELLRKYQE